MLDRAEADHAELLQQTECAVAQSRWHIARMTAAEEQIRLRLLASRTALAASRALLRTWRVP